MGLGAPEDIETLLRLAQSGTFGGRVIAALMRRILEIQDSASEAEILAIIAEVETLLAEGDGTDH